MLPESSVPRWRLYLALLLLCVFPFSALFAGLRQNEKAALPSQAELLFLLTAIELGFFAFCFALAHSAARYTPDELLLRWRDGSKTIWRGLLYSFAARILVSVGMLIILVPVVVVASLKGMTPDQLKQLVQAYAPNPGSVVDPAALSNPLYLFVLLTWISFVVAGLREELWRVAMLATGARLFPNPKSAIGAKIIMLIASSLLFGIAHIYQGPLAVLMTALIGAFFGAVMLYHRSIWPAVIAHGAFNALSFLMIPFVKDLKM
jgi:membrane protease YdiL (CAAX protease family)